MLFSLGVGYEGVYIRLCCMSMGVFWELVYDVQQTKINRRVATSRSWNTISQMSLAHFSSKVWYIPNCFHAGGGRSNANTMWSAQYSIKSGSMWPMKSHLEWWTDGSSGWGPPNLMTSATIWDQNGAPSLWKWKEAASLWPLNAFWMQWKTSMSTLLLRQPKKLLL